MTKIVISYRRQDSDAITGRIRDRLVTEYGVDSIFMDIDSIPFGIDFREHIAGVMKNSDILIAVIGPNWLVDRQGRNRIQEQDDPVRVEIERALENKIAVWPVLIGGASMPAAHSLPASIRKLADYNAADIDAGRNFHPNVDRILRQLNVALGRATLLGAARVRAARALNWRTAATLTALAVTAYATSSPIRGPSGGVAGTAVISGGRLAANMVSCSEEPKLRSLGTTSPTSISFTNRSSDVRNVFWIDHAGKRVLYSSLKPGQNIAQRTFLTHPWIVTNASGDCQSIFMPTSGESIATIAR